MTRMSPSCSYYRWILFTAPVLLMAACASSSDSSPEARPAGSASTVVAAVTVPSPAGSSTVDGTFRQVAGWITYSGDDGILAVNPAHPKRLVRLSDTGGEPLAWSSDGTKLLIRRRSGRSAALYVLGADGSQTRLTYEPFGGSHLQSGGSFSPDGSQVVYADGPWDQTAIYTVSSDGGASRLILRTTRQVSFPDGHRARAFAYQPALSPDGSRIAYFDGMYDHSHNLWVANADGTDRHVILDDKVSAVSAAGHMKALTWSPDGKWLAFTTDDSIYLVRQDGSGLRRLVSSSFSFVSAPAVQWSHDSSQIAYLRPGDTCVSVTGKDEDFTCDAGQLYIVNVDGSSDRVITGMRTPAIASIAWNPKA